MKAQLHAHQREAVAKMHNGCVLWGDVGTGKTITSLGYALEKEPYRKIVIVTTAKVRDSFAWEREAAKLLIPVDNIEVTSWNKINELVDYEGKFFIFDEQRLVGAGAWVKAFYKIAKKNHWILLSATPGDTWSDYAPMFIANGWYKNITEFRREHAIYSRFTQYPKIERWVNEGRLLKYRKCLLVEMPMERHTTKHMHYIECSFDAETLETVRKKRWNVYEDKPLANAAELYGVMRKVVSSDPDRAEKMADLIRTHPRLIVFYNFNYELEILREICQQISLESQTDTVSLPTSLTTNWQTSPNGLVLPDGFTTEQNDDSNHNLPPWDLTPEEQASGQKVTTRRIITKENEAWNPTELKKSTTTSSPTSRPKSNSPSLSSPSSPRLTSPTSTTKSSHAGRQLETTAQPSEQHSRRTPESDRARTASPTSESHPPVKQPTEKTTSRHAGAQPAKTAISSVRPTPSSPTSTELTTRTSSPRPTTAQQRGHQKASELWTTTSSHSSTSMTSHQSQPEPSEPSSSYEGSGSTRTSTRPSSTTFGWGEWNGHKHQPIPDTDRWVYLVQYASGSEGWNCIETNQTAFWSLTYSWKQFIQAQGRTDRLNTPYSDLHYHVLITDSLAEKPVMKALDQKHDFQPKM